MQKIQELEEKGISVLVKKTSTNEEEKLILNKRKTKHKKYSNTKSSF